MAIIQLQLDEQTADRLQQLAADRQTTPEELIRDLVAKAQPGEVISQTNGTEPVKGDGAVKDPFRGMFADIPEVIDEIVADAMAARGRGSL